MGVCFIQDMWGKAMHMHRAADLLTSEEVGLKNVPGYFFCGCRTRSESCLRHVMRIKMDTCAGFSCITAIKSVA